MNHAWIIHIGIVAEMKLYRGYHKEYIYICIHICVYDQIKLNPMP